MSDQRLKFQVKYNCTTNPTESTIIVEKGKIVEVQEEDVYYSSKYTPENEHYKGEFEYKLSKILEEMLYHRKDTYENLLNSLSSEMLDKYFKPFYIPK